MHGCLLTCAGLEQMEEVAMVKRDLLASCMTCPLCHKLFRHATTISECLHTFCRKCIYEKLTDEEVDCCPVCKIDLGCAPVEKLRPDPNIQDLRTKIFPLKRRKIIATEAVLPIKLPVRRKEVSLSSLTPNRRATQTGLTGRRTKPTPRRASSLRGISPIIDEPIKEGRNGENHVENPSSPETLAKIAQKRKYSHNVEPSNHIANKDIENGVESFKDQPELWKPLNCLVEAANRTRTSKSSPQTSLIKAERTNGHSSELPMQTTKIRLHLNKSNIQETDSGGTPGTPGVPVTVKAKRRRKRRVLGTSAQALIDDGGATLERRICPIWFSLVPSFDQKEEPKFPRIPACYLRIKDRNLPVSFIQKYLIKKLNLSSEDEVEITCEGQPVSPTLPLHSLVDVWLRYRPSGRLQVSVGSSAKDFVMVLNYSFKSPAL